MRRLTAQIALALTSAALTWVLAGALLAPDGLGALNEQLLRHWDADATDDTSAPRGLDARPTATEHTDAGGDGAPPTDTAMPFAAHPDPQIGITLRPDAELRIAHVLLRSDHLGMRADPGPPAPAEAFRVVVLGDSVAFGYGVPDDQTLGAHLQRLLGAHGRPVSVRTVALPGWNQRNSTRFLLSHWDELACDLVLFLPISNDVDNSSTVVDGERRVLLGDPDSRDPLLRVGMNVPVGLATLARGAAATRPPSDEPLSLGALALGADLSPESSLRLDTNARLLVELRDALEQRGCELVVVRYSARDTYVGRLCLRVAEQTTLPLVVSCFRDPPPAFSLPDDPHPNGRTLEVMAGWIVEALVADERLPADVRPASPPPAPAAYQAARDHDAGPELWARRSAQARATALGQLVGVLDPQTGAGCWQVFGGLQPFGHLETHALVLMPRGDGQLRVRVAALPRHPELLPQQLDVLADGQLLGTLTLTDLSAVERRWALPPGDGPVEIGLQAARGARTFAGSRVVEASCLLERLATRD